MLLEAQNLARSLSAHDRAAASEALARWSSAANLHGDALHHMKDAIDLRQEMAETHPRLMAARTARTQELLAALAAEALKVTRSPAELNDLAVLGQDWLRLAPDPPVAHWHWLQRAQSEAEAAWSARMGVNWGILPERVKADLTESHTLYRSATDLGVVVFYLARATELLLRRVVKSPDSNWDNRGSLGLLLQQLNDSKIRTRLQRSTDSRGRENDLVKLRNDFAHGNAMKVDRLAVDGLIRTLAIGQEAVLPDLAQRLHARTGDQP
jgi:hypothetical protein